MLNAWKLVFGKNASMVRDAVQQASLTLEDNIELLEVLHDIADERGEINHRKLGW